MSAELESAAQFLASMSPDRRLEFLAAFAHDLTVAGRVVDDPDAPFQVRAQDLRALNEIQHRVTSYISHMAGGDEDPGWLVPVLTYVFEQDNPRVKDAAVTMWTRLHKNWLAVA